MSEKTFPSPDEEMFALWRAVFALVHVDGNFAEEEKTYIEKIIAHFSFTDEQENTIRKDLDNKEDVVSLFKDIKSENYQRQFFVMARTIVWCDGFLHELELKAVNKIAQNLKSRRAKFQNELRWIERKPFIEEGCSPNEPEEDVMQIVIRKMSAFYEEKTI